MPRWPDAALATGTARPNFRQRARAADLNDASKDRQPAIRMPDVSRPAKSRRLQPSASPHISRSAGKNARSAGSRAWWLPAYARAPTRQRLRCSKSPGEGRCRRSPGPLCARRARPGKLDLDLEGRDISFALQIDLDLLARTGNVFFDDLENVFLKPRQKVRPGPILPLMGEQNLEPFLGGLRRTLGLRAPEKAEQAHAVPHRSRRSSPRRSGPRMRSSVCSPISRDTASA